MTRISNWAEMSVEERERTLHIVNRRNQERMERLKARQERAADGMWAGTPGSPTPNPLHGHDEL